jgi:hypothetical protein
MNKSLTGYNIALFSVLAAVIIIGVIVSCSDFGSKPLPLSVVFTTEVHGYLEPCG